HAAALFFASSSTLISAFRSTRTSCAPQPSPQATAPTFSSSPAPRPQPSASPPSPRATSKSRPSPNTQAASRFSLPSNPSPTAPPERNFASVLVDAGSHLNEAFPRHSLVDKAVPFPSQPAPGEQALPFAYGVPSPLDPEPTRRHVTREPF